MSKLRAVQKDTFPDYSEQLALDIYGFQHSFVYLSLSEQRTLNESGIHFFKIEKKKNHHTDQHMYSQHGLGTWHRALIMEGGPALESQEGRRLISPPHPHNPSPHFCLQDTGS